MIGMLNIPPLSPIEFNRAKRFSFPLSSTDEELFLATFCEGSARRKRPEYLLDGRKLSEDGRPIESISPADYWKQSIWRRQLWNQFGIDQKGAAAASNGQSIEKEPQKRELRGWGRRKVCQGEGSKGAIRRSAREGGNSPRNPVKIPSRPLTSGHELGGVASLRVSTLFCLANSGMPSPLLIYYFIFSVVPPSFIVHFLAKLRPQRRYSSSIFYINYADEEEGGGRRDYEENINNSDRHHDHDQYCTELESELFAQ